MEKMNIEDLKSRVRKEWSDKGNTKSAINLVISSFGMDSLEDALDDMLYDYRDSVLGNLQTELQHATDEFDDPEDSTYDVRRVIDAIDDVQDSNDYLFDMGLGPLDAQPLDIDDFLEVVDDLNDNYSIE